MSLGINTRITNTTEQPSTLGRGKTLYVGGTGEGNYTKIQDAIDDADDGDTVFVYDDSSPYYEHVVVNKSIFLIGEDKDTTVIDGGKIGDVVYISVDNVTISGFTIQNSGDESNDAVIDIRSNSNTITGNTITSNNDDGIRLSGDSNTITGNTITSNNDEGIYIGYSDSNTITGNTISGNSIGIVAGDSSGNTIKGNNITNNELSIGLAESSSNTITDNIISGRIIGIYLQNSSTNTIKGNNITNNRYGIYLWDSMRNNIFKNNFLDNKQNVYFRSTLFSRNRWKQNYWNRSQILPKLIFGYVVIGSIWIPWVNIDWRPALRPYEI